jgi:hypothetical protein
MSPYPLSFLSSLSPTRDLFSPPHHRTPFFFFFSSILLLLYSTRTQWERRESEIERLRGISERESWEQRNETERESREVESEIGRVEGDGARSSGGWHRRDQRTLATRSPVSSWTRDDPGERTQNPWSSDPRPKTLETRPARNGFPANPPTNQSRFSVIYSVDFLGKSSKWVNPII